jgi:hypothetical protein
MIALIFVRRTISMQRDMATGGAAPTVGSAYGAGSSRELLASMFAD